MKDIRNKAKELMKGSCRNCSICNGKVCAGEVPGMGGLGTGAAFRNNVDALSFLNFNMRLLHGAKEPVTACSWMGMKLSMPVVASPIGGMFNFNDACTEEEYIRAVLEGSKTAGIIGCSGDGVPPVISGTGFDTIKAMGGHGIPFIKPWESDELDEKMGKAFDSGCAFVGMDIDAAGLVTLRKMGRPVGPKTPEELTAIVSKAHKAGKKFILKGVMTVSDARVAVDAGVDCIVVSNHGGRVLDFAPGVAEVLPDIVAAVGGRLSIMADGGVRSGGDVLKLLALGADMVGIGRPVTLAAIGGGAEGVAKYFQGIQTELAQIMLMTGCADLASVNEDILFG